MCVRKSKFEMTGWTGKGKTSERVVVYDVTESLCTHNNSKRRPHK